MAGILQISGNNFFRKPMLRWLILGLAVLGVGASTVAIFWIFAKPSPPDPQKADIKTAIEFAKSQQFLDMNSEQRGRYVESLVKRYAAMNTQGRADAAEAFRCLRRENPKGEKVFWMTFVTKRSEQYHKLPSDQKRRYIDNLLDKMETLGGSERMKRNFDRHFGRRSSSSGRRKSIRRNQRNVRLLLEKTSAEERSKISRTAGDIIDRLRHRYGENTN